MEAEVAAEIARTAGPGLPAWAFAISAIAIIGAAVYGAFWQRTIAKRNMTFQTLMTQLWDQDYISQRSTFISISENDSGKEIEKLGLRENEREDKAVAIRSILNNYELIAIGIKHGVLDEDIYVQYWRATACRDFERMKPFITEGRKRWPKIYIEFEALYEKWRS